MKEEDFQQWVSTGALPAMPMPAWAVGFWNCAGLTELQKRALSVYTYGALQGGGWHHLQIGPWKDDHKFNFGKVEYPAWATLGIQAYLPVFREATSISVCIGQSLGWKKPCDPRVTLTPAELDDVLGVVASRQAEQIPAPYNPKAFNRPFQNVTLQVQNLTDEHAAVVAKWLPGTMLYLHIMDASAMTEVGVAALAGGAAALKGDEYGRRGVSVCGTKDSPLAKAHRKWAAAAPKAMTDLFHFGEIMIE